MPQIAGFLYTFCHKLQPFKAKIATNCKVFEPNLPQIARTLKLFAIGQ